jgi:phosphate transport system substrate-binding protein
MQKHWKLATVFGLVASTIALSVPEVQSQSKVSIIGAGASFPAPLYQRWFSEYNKSNPAVQVSYQSVGSGAGVEQFIQGTVDFGASDVAMKNEEMTKVKKGVVMLPMTAGSIVLGYNLSGVSGLKLSRQNYVDIFMGKIKKWNDPALAKTNPGVQLPNKNIKVVRRSDGSGTTGVFTQHLSTISPEWAKKVGSGKTVDWPTGVGAKGNEGITAQIMQTDGSIGYLEYGYAKQQNISTAILQNKAGKFIAPSLQAAAKALEAVKLPTNLRAFILDPTGADSYPIVTYTWILAYKKYDNPAKVKALKSVMNWALKDGQKYSEQLGYVPLPQKVRTQVESALSTIQ